MSLALPNFAHAKILVIGDIMLDRYWSGSTSRISPEAPVPVVKVGDIEDRLGGAANVANNLAALGCEVGLCGLIGEDEAASITRRLLAKGKIIDHCIADAGAPTITKLRVMSRNQQLMRMDFEEKLSEQADEMVADKVANVLANFNGVIISDYAKGTVRSAHAVISLCKDRGIPVFVDPKGSDFSRYRGADFITPNRAELEAIIGTCGSLEEIFTETAALCLETQSQGILVTLSEQGMALVSTRQKPVHMPTVARDVYDVTGAGDTVIATFAAAYVSGADLQSSMRLANVAAGVVVGKLGTSAVSETELQRAVAQGDTHLRQGILNLHELLDQVAHCRRRGEKIVFTNGCFDILHAGHVRYLKQAAALGDRMVVAMNSDASISKLKGPNRPIVGLEERMEVMSSLNCVDWVVAFGDETPMALIQQILPDVLAKGGDYVAEEIIGFDVVTEHGGEVKVLPFVEGNSTTSIVDKISKLK